jgi:hypothetical protein
VVSLAKFIPTADVQNSNLELGLASIQRANFIKRAEYNWAIRAASKVVTQGKK